MTGDCVKLRNRYEVNVVDVDRDQSSNTDRKQDEQNSIYIHILK